MAEDSKDNGAPMNPETEHDVWCSADRRKPVGCEMCSCVGRRANPETERPMIERLAEALRERNGGMCMEYCDLERDWDDLPPRTHDDKCAAVRALLAEYDAAQAGRRNEQVRRDRDRERDAGDMAEIAALTVKQLIETLAQFPPDVFVVVDGYEWGVGRINAECVRIGTACLDRNAEELGDGPSEMQVVYIDRRHSPDRDSYGMCYRMSDE